MKMEIFKFLAVNFGIAIVLFLPIFFFLMRYHKKNKADYDFVSYDWKGDVSYHGEKIKVEFGDKVRVAITKKAKNET